MAEWNEDQEWERQWWGTCVNTMCEEAKQISYAHRMGLVNTPQGEFWPVYNLEGKSVIDIGGGPVSMLLRTINGGKLLVAEPCAYPSWTIDRYASHNIDHLQCAGEDLVPEDHEYDEAWIYNVLQHVKDPALIIANARKIAKTIRLFEWVNIPACPGHPQELKAQLLDEWLGGRGTVERMNGENNCYGTAYYGVFAGE